MFAAGARSATQRTVAVRSKKRGRFVVTAQVHQFICRSDNFGVLVHHPASGATATIDAPDGNAVLAALGKTGWNLTDILVTHHHADHVDGIPALKQRFP